MKISMKRGMAFVLVLLMALAIPVLPGNYFTDTGDNVYAADTEVRVNLSKVTKDLSIRSSGGSIWINTKSALATDFKKVGNLVGTKVMLYGELKNTKGKIDVKSDVNEKNKPINIYLSNAWIYNDATSTKENPNSVFRIDSSSVDIELKKDSENYIVTEAQYGSCIELTGKSNLTIRGAGFLYVFSVHDYPIGSGIGGGYSLDSGIEIGDINIIDGADVFASVEKGAGIGGGYTEGDDSRITTGSINIDKAYVYSTAYSNGAGIGGGATYGENSSISVKGINIVNDSGASATGYEGAGIGGGYTRTSTSDINVGDIDIIDSEVDSDSNRGSSIGGGFSPNANVSAGDINLNGAMIYAYTGMGAGVGGGLSYNGGILGGNISISSSEVNAFVDDGAGIGGGMTTNPGSDLSLGTIIIDGDFISAYADTGNDIGAGDIAGTISAGAVYISGGSVYAEYDSIFPAPLSADGEPVYKVLVPYVASEEGKEIIVDIGTREYRAIMPLAENLFWDDEYFDEEFFDDEFFDDDFWIIEPDGAYLYLPEGNYNLTVGSTFGKAKVVPTVGDVENIARVYAFKDVKTTFWGRSAVEYVFFENLMNGVTSTYFKPNDPMTRAMFVTVIGRMDGNKDGYAATAFNDVEQYSYYANHVKWANENNIVKGISATKFAPNNKITRQEVAAIIVRYAEYLGIPLTTAGAAGYPDLNQASAWAKEDILKAQAAGIMTGTKGGKFEPKKNISRAEAAQMLKNFRENVL